MLRAKSFNINQKTESGHLMRSSSFSDMRLLPEISVDIRIFITVKEVSPEEAIRAVSVIGKNMDVDWVNFNSTKSLSDEQEKWHQRYDNAINIFSSILYEARHSLKRLQVKKSIQVTRLFYVSYFRNIPIGILQLSLEHNEIPEVSFLAIHCGIRGCGILLIEEAINKSQQVGMEGKLQLYPLTGSELAYMQMGFIKHGEDLILDPAEKSNKWKWSEKEKRYKSFC